MHEAHATSVFLPEIVPKRGEKDLISTCHVAHFFII